MSKCPKCSKKCEEGTIDYEYGGLVLHDIKALRCPNCKEELFTMEQCDATRDRLPERINICRSGWYFNFHCLRK